MVTKPNINLEFLLKHRTLAFAGLLTLAAIMLPKQCLGNMHIQGKAQPTITQNMTAPVEEGYRLIERARGNVSVNENERCLNQACTIFSDTLKTDSLNYKAIRGSGIVNLIRGNLDAAILQFKKASECGETDLGLLLDTSDAYRRSGKFSKAEKYAKKALEINPDSCVAISKLGLIAFDKGKYDDAIKHYDEALQQNNKYVPAWANKALAQLKKEDFEGARKSIDEALTLDPTDAYAWVVNGMIYEGTGACEQARISVETAVSLKPYALTFREILKKINCDN